MPIYPCDPPLVAHHRAVEYRGAGAPDIGSPDQNHGWRIAAPLNMPQARDLGKYKPHPVGLLTSPGKFLRYLLIEYQTERPKNEQGRHQSR